MASGCSVKSPLLTPSLAYIFTSIKLKRKEEFLKYYRKGVKDVISKDVTYLPVIALCLKNGICVLHI
jgi:hypothetical protein